MVPEPVEASKGPTRHTRTIYKSDRGARGSVAATAVSSAPTITTAVSAITSSVVIGVVVVGFPAIGVHHRGFSTARSVPGPFRPRLFARLGALPQPDDHAQPDQEGEDGG